MTQTDETAYGPSWYAATMVPTAPREPLSYDIDVDACVIGGGFAGLSTAYELARRGWSVAVLESQRLAWNASGRNGGFVSPGYAEGIDRIVERVGRERAKALWGLSEEGVASIRRAIAETGMLGAFPVPGRINVQRVNDEKGMAAEAELLNSFGSDVEFWPTAQVRRALITRDYFQALHFPSAFHIHPLNYALGLASAAERAGARLFEGTPAVAIDPAGVRKHVQTPKARVRAGHIVLAGGPHLGKVFPYVADTVLPVATYVAVTAPLGERILEAVRTMAAVADTRRAGDYYRIVDGDRLLWGGRITTRLATPRRLARLMRADIRRVYPQLDDVEIEYAWSGTMAYAVHKMPQIGEVAPGLWLASAFGGQGLNTSAMAGNLIASAIAEGDDRWRLFMPYGLVWAAGRIGRAATQAVYWSMQARDAVAERWSQLLHIRHQRAMTREEKRLAAEAAREAAAEEARREKAEEARRTEDRIKREAAEEAARRLVAERHREEEAAAQAGRDAAQAARYAAEAMARVEQAVQQAREKSAAAAPAADASVVVAERAETQETAVRTEEPEAMPTAEVEPVAEAAPAAESVPVAEAEPPAEAAPTAELEPTAPAPSEPEQEPSAAEEPKPARKRRRKAKT